MSAQKTNPSVSIITPVYNAAKYLQDTIDTVQKQTYKNWELLLIDDGSSDNSVAIIEAAKQQDSRIRLFHNPKNMGAAKSRNEGVRRARGRYIAYLDADDLWLPEKLEAQLAFIATESCPFVYSGYEFADEAGVPTGKRVIPPRQMTYKTCLRNPIIWTSTVLIDTDVIKKEYMMMPDVRRGQDAATWWQILKHIDSAHGQQEVLAFYRRVSSSLSANKVKALKRTWYLYRSVEKLSLGKTLIIYPQYVFHAIKKRI